MEQVKNIVVSKELSFEYFSVDGSLLLKSTRLGGDDISMPKRDAQALTAALRNIYGDN
jgi:hypothetical protein